MNWTSAFRVFESEDNKTKQNEKKIKNTKIQFYNYTGASIIP